MFEIPKSKNTIVMKVGGIGKKIANSKLMGKYNLEIGFIASTFFAAKAKNRKEIDYMTDSHMPEP